MFIWPIVQNLDFNQTNVFFWLDSECKYNTWRKAQYAENSNKQQHITSTFILYLLENEQAMQSFDKNLSDNYYNASLLSSIL